MTCRVAVLLFPGVNRERDVIAALRLIPACNPVIVWHDEKRLPPVEALVIPGGFSYGDYLRPGAIAARSPIMSDVLRRARDGMPILGICNGFQILTEVGLLPGALMRNVSLKFLCRNIHLRVENAGTCFTSLYRQGQVISVPIANASGNYVADQKTLSYLESEERIVFRYCNAQGQVDKSHNPGGSLGSIAGVVNKARNVLGMMPHPENQVSKLSGGGEGLALFRGLLRWTA